MNPVPGGQIWTADELLTMTPNERHEILKASIVTDFAQVPPELLERARANVVAHIAETESAAPADWSWSERSLDTSPSEVSKSGAMRYFDLLKDSIPLLAVKPRQNVEV